MYFRPKGIFFSFSASHSMVSTRSLSSAPKSVQLPGERFRFTDLQSHSGMEQSKKSPVSLRSCKMTLGERMASVCRSSPNPGPRCQPANFKPSFVFQGVCLCAYFRYLCLGYLSDGVIIIDTIPTTAGFCDGAVLSPGAFGLDED